MSDPTITGRARRRGGRRTVYWADRVAKWLIVAGGIGTILAVSLVFVFLVSVVAPLFRPAQAGPRVESAWSATGTKIEPGAGPERIVIDDYSKAAIVLSGAGGVALARLSDGKRLDEQALFQDDVVTAIALGDHSPLALVGLASGAVRPLALNFEEEFLAADRLPPELAENPLGAAVPWQKGLATRVAPDQFRLERLAARLEPRIPLALAGSVRRLDFSKRSHDFVVAALTAAGRLTLAEVNRHENDVSGEVEYEVAASSTIPWQEQAPGRDLPDYLLVSGLGDNVYLAWNDGELLRYFTGDIESPRFAERRDVVPDAEGRLTAVRFAAGGGTLVTGDSRGVVRAWFRAKSEGLGTPDRAMLVAAHEFPPTGAAVTCLASSARGRSMVAGHADGTLRVLYLTTEKTLVAMDLGSGQSPRALALAPRDDAVVALAADRLSSWRLDPGYPEVGFRALFLPVWYEGHAGPSYIWQSSAGTEGSEPKLSLIPLVFGTLKATFYALLFGAPLALCGAIYTSEFMQPSLRSKVKPVIEMMASLPSVVLGYIAGLILAPLTEHVLSSVVASLFTTPLACLIAAHAWQLLPARWTLLLARWRLAFILTTLPLGLAAGMAIGPWMERGLFGGDLRAWLDGQIANPLGGWVVLLTPPAVVAVAWMMTFVNAGLRKHAYGWNRRTRAWVEAGKFAAAVVATLASAWLMASLLTFLGFDPRGGLVGSYVQRNALIVGFVMGFAIIPLIYTIADDALSTVPDHLRSASLGAGATPWQTAIRIVIPTAMSGLFSALMIGLGRAVGETMIVLMAAGNTPIMDWNIFNGFQTLSAMVATEMPEQVEGSSLYRAIFFAALTLFMLTFLLNTVAELVRLRFRGRAYEL